MVEGLELSALVVDDNWYNRDICRIALENVGYKVTEADHGSVAMNFLEQQTFNLTVLDLQMPTISGATVLDWIRHSAKHNAMFVIVITANPHMVTDEIDDLADYVMNKPINVMEFAQFVDRLKTGRKRSVDVH